MKKQIHVSILGASGYGAGELLRLLVNHPDVEVVSLVSNSRAGESVGSLHPHLRGFYNIGLEEHIAWTQMLAAEYAVVFSAMPSGVSGRAIDGVLRECNTPNLKVIDLSGDMRLTQAEIHARAYPESPYLSETRCQFAYGLVELNRDAIKAARCIANPGCMATAAILAAAPIVGKDFRGLIAIDAKTGSTGSGRSLKETTHHPTRHSDFRAYKPLERQHEPEVLQALGDPFGSRIEMSFVPQSMDVARGIFTTVHASLPENTDTAAVKTRYETFYSESPFVRIVEGSPTLQDVIGSNFCDIAVAVRRRQIIVMAALDNLVKGMAGAAIQNMNLMCGLPETTGLWTPSFRPA